jgi:hypothetical protein
VENLLFAGRNISATHMAMSSARVMGTCATIGQAVGAAAAVCKKYGVTLRGVCGHMDELQQLLLQHDCYLPKVERKVHDLCFNATLVGANDVIRNGKDRDFHDEENGEMLKNGAVVRYTFAKPTFVGGVKLVFDSDLQRKTYDIDACEKHHYTRCNVLEDSPIMRLPDTLAKAYAVKIVDKEGREEIIGLEEENKRRNVLLPIEKEVQEVSLCVLENWGNTASTRVFTFELYNE